MPTTDTYYDLLGVGPSAGQDEIRSAYRQLLKLVHPDGGGNRALFEQVQRAWAVLSDPVQRRIYDEELAGPGGNTTQRSAPEDDLFGPGTSWHDAEPRQTAPPTDSRTDEEPPAAPRYAHVERAPAGLGLRYGAPLVALALLWGGEAGSLPTIAGHASMAAGWADGLAGGVLSLAVTAVRLRLRRHFRLAPFWAYLALGIILGGAVLEFTAWQHGASWTLLLVGAAVAAAAASPYWVRRQLLGLEAAKRAPLRRRSVRP